MDKKPEAVSHQVLGLATYDYELLRSVLEQEYGIDLRQMGSEQVLAKVHKYCAEHGLASISASVADLRANQSKIHALGGHIYSRRTWFNRIPEHFGFLVEAARKRKEQSQASSILNIWSAACSTGQEAYTAAIYMMEYVFNDASSWNKFRVIGSDCAESSLREAEAGRYELADILNLQPIHPSRYFDDDSSGHATVRRELRDRVTFRPINLTSASYGFERELDFILLRNALDFHTTASRQLILKKMHACLQQDGVLVMGNYPGMEQESVLRCGYEPIAPGCYRAKGAGSA